MKPPTATTIPDLLDTWAAATPEAEAAVMQDTRISFAALRDSARHEAAAMWALGVRPGDRVAVLSPPRPEFFATMLAVWLLGAVYQGLNPKGGEPELVQQLRGGDPAALIWHGHEGVGEQAERIKSAADLACPVIGPDDRPAYLRRGERQLGVVAAARASLDCQASVALVYTSGTTGEPKGAVLPHQAFVLCAQVQAARWLDHPGMRAPCIEPINHVAAVGDMCVSMMAGGGTVVFLDDFEPDALLRVIGEERIDFWYTDPAVLGLCVRSSAWAQTDLGRIRRISWSGGRAPRSLVRELRARVPLLATSWGMTETVGSLTYTDMEASDEVLASSVGKPDPAYRLGPIDDQGRPCAVDEPGELRVAPGTYLMTGYWRSPAETRDAFDARGWFRSGDIAVRSGDGNLRLVGRTSQMFRSGGESIHPAEVERALETHPSVVTAVVVAVPHELWGEVGHAFVVKRHDRPVDLDELRGHLRGSLARFKAPKGITMLDRLPLLPNGKVDRRHLMERATSEAGR